MNRILTEQDGVLSVADISVTGSVSTGVLNAGVVSSSDIRAPEGASELYLSKQVGGERGAGFILNLDDGTITYSDGHGGSGSIAMSDDLDAAIGRISDVESAVATERDRIDALIDSSGLVKDEKIPNTIARQSALSEVSSSVVDINSTLEQVIDDRNRVIESAIPSTILRRDDILDSSDKILTSVLPSSVTALPDRVTAVEGRFDSDGVLKTANLPSSAMRKSEFVDDESGDIKESKIPDTIARKEYVDDTFVTAAQVADSYLKKTDAVSTYMAIADYTEELASGGVTTRVILDAKIPDTIARKSYLDETYMRRDEMEQTISNLTEQFFNAIDGLNENVTSLSDQVTELTAGLSQKANSEDVYTKDEVYAKSETYTKDETSGMLSEAVSGLTEGLFSKGIRGYTYTNSGAVTNSLSFTTFPSGWSVGDLVSVIANGTAYLSVARIASIAGSFSSWVPAPSRYDNDDPENPISGSIDITWVPYSDVDTPYGWIPKVNGTGIGDPMSQDPNAVSLSYGDGSWLTASREYQNSTTITFDQNLPFETVTSDVQYTHAAFVSSKPSTGDTVVIVLSNEDSMIAEEDRFDEWLSGKAVNAGQGSGTVDYGVAIGVDARAVANSIQLGTGINATANTLQVFGNTLLDANGKVPNDRLYSSEGLDPDDYYDRNAIDTKLSAKADVNNVFTKDEVYPKNETYDSTTIDNRFQELESSMGSSAFGSWKNGSSIAAGNASTTGTSSYSVALGDSASGGSTVTGSTVTNTVAVGHGAKAGNNGAIAVGANSQSGGEDSVAIGRGAVAGYANSIEIGNGSSTAANTFCLWSIPVFRLEGGAVKPSDGILGDSLSLSTAMELFAMKESYLGRNRHTVNSDDSGFTGSVTLSPNTITCVDIVLPQTANGKITVNLVLNNTAPTSGNTGDDFADDTLLMVRCLNHDASTVGITGAYDIELKTMCGNSATVPGSVVLLSSDSKVLKNVAYGVWTLFSFLDATKYTGNANSDTDKAFVVVSKRELSVVEQ